MPNKIEAALTLMAAAWAVLLAIAWNSEPNLQGLEQQKSILWLTAHPDDEAFFFGPTLTKLLAPPNYTNKENQTIPRGRRQYGTGHLLSLSIGDYDGIGAKRIPELKESCRMFGIEQHNCVAVDDPRLRDGPDAVWDASAINEIVKSYIDKWSIDLIFTFDPLGVSGHPNHASIPKALSTLPSPAPSIYSVISSPTHSKYTSILLVGLKHLRINTLSPSKRIFFTSNPPEFMLTKLAFESHESQKTWYRTLYSTFSHYLWWVEVLPLEEAMKAVEAEAANGKGTKVEL